MNKLFEKLDDVVDERSFIYFISLLGNDFNRNGNAWENHELDKYFESAYSWAEASMDGLEFYMKCNNPWRRCAEILYMGKIYE